MAENEVSFDDVDLGDISEDSLDDLDLSNFGEVDDSIDFPHIKVSTKQLVEFLKVAKSVCSSGGRDVVSKAVCMEPVGETLECRATDFDVYVKRDLEILNTENRLSEIVIIPTDILIKLMKAVPVNTIIYKKDDEFFIRLYGGDIILETHTMSSDKFKCMDEMDQVGAIEASDLYSVVKDFSPTILAAISPQERRIIFEKDGAHARYLWSILKADKEFSDFDLKVKDVGVIKILTVGSEEMLKVFISKDVDAVKRCSLRGEKFEYTFLVSETAVNETMKTDMSEIISNTGVYVDFLQVYKMVELASDLPYSTGKIGMNFTEEGVNLSIKTKKGNDSNFNISGSIEGDVVPLAEELQLQAKLLKVLMRTFANKSSIKICLSDKGYGMVADSYSAVMFKESN